ncbi:MAG: protein kinase [Chloroflexi bacterium]|nr:protein kinase [Chloroflexota bacterium]
MTKTPTSTYTSLQGKPGLRWALISLWIIIVAYTVIVFAQAIPLFFAAIPGGEDGIPLSNLNYILLSLFDLGVDLLMLLGFSLIAFSLFFRRSDNWFAIFTSLFMITFAARISNVINAAALQPGFESRAGLLLALGDIGIVLFNLLFPTGKFAPRWFKFLIPVLAVTMLGIYLFPNAPFHWQKMGQGNYLIFTIAWYLTGMASFIYRYHREAGILQKQQMRSVTIGLLGPFFWYLLFNLSQILFSGLFSTSVFANTIFLLLARVSSIFLFLMLPLFIAISISRTRLFDIDLLIHRSLVYGGLTTGLGLTFAILLGLISLAFRTIHPGEQSMLAVTVSAVTAGALFQPARKRLQHFVDRTIYRIKIDYDKTLYESPADSDRGRSEITLPSYRKMRLIGRGGMADVYRAENPDTGQAVAVKVLSASLSSDENFRRRFTREAETVSGLAHPNIVRIFNYGEENGTYFIAMELLTGPDLRNLLKAEGRIGLDESLLMLREIASALDYAHQRGLVHRDIKPSNIMLDSTTLPPRVVLTDFGIAKIADAQTRITASGMLGTFDYIAPEQIQSAGEVDGRADIYALGVMSYQMMTGRLPFEHSNTGALLLAHLNAPPPDAREIISDLPRSTAHAIQQSMAKNPAERFSTATEFVLALEGA